MEIAARSLRLVQAATPTGLSDALGNCPIAERGSLEPHLVALPFLVGMDLATATRADGAERAQVARLATLPSHEPVRKEDEPTDVSSPHAVQASSWLTMSYPLDPGR